jgi:hypothetical protein
MKARNACYDSVHNFFLSGSLFKNTQKYNYSCFFYGCETWSFTLKEKQSLKVLENRALRETFKRDGVTGDWKTLLNDKPHIVRTIKPRMKRGVGHVARMGLRRGAYRVLVGKHEGNKPLGKPERRWEDNIKMDLQEMG